MRIVEQVDELDVLSLQTELLRGHNEEAAQATFCCRLKKTKQIGK